MSSKLRIAMLATAGLLLMGVAYGQEHQHPSSDSSHDDHSMAGMEMPKNSSNTQAEEEMNAVTHAMSSHHMETGPHMKMTELRKPQPGDQERAGRVVEQARQVMSKYQDYHTALNEGFEIFLPDVPQHQYHFTNYSYAFEARRHFNPEHPTSLLYDKTPNGYKLAGVMYTAPARFDEDDLNDRIPLSVAQWHEHMNFCFPPNGRESGAWQKNPKFGMGGSISTREACDAAGGRFVPLLFGWMVHVYPNDKNVWAIWPGMHHH